MMLLLFLAATPLDVKVDENVGDRIPDLLLADHRGEEVHLSELGSRPIVLVLAYYRCPMLCSLVQSGVTRTIEASSAKPGRDFELATISFDPTETSADASKRRVASHPEWRFLVGSEQAIEALLESAGVTVAKDANGQWAHPAVFLVLTPDRRISRYLYGFDVSPRDLERAVKAAARGDSGPSFARMLLRCFSYDPADRRYGPAIATAFRAGGIVLFTLVAGAIAFLFKRDGRRRA